MVGRTASTLILLTLLLTACPPAQEEPPEVAPGGADLPLGWTAIPGGTFLMGSEDGPLDERPVRRVTIAPFLLTRSEVTVAQYDACVEAGVCRRPRRGEGCNAHIPERREHPVNCVSWRDAWTFAHWVDGRLPTEAEWEYAARGGGRARSYPWGEAPATCERAVLGHGRARGWPFSPADGCGLQSTWPVCSKPAGNSSHGLCDMAGNVYEWVADWYHPSYAGAPVDGSTRQDAPEAGGAVRSSRGGSYGFQARKLRNRYRAYSVPEARSRDQGFRVARDANVAAPPPRAERRP